MNSQTLRGPLGWSLASIAFILVFCIYAITTVSTPLLQQQNPATDVSKTEPLVNQYNESVAVDIARFNGRSAFFKPIRIIVHREPPPPPPPPPSPTGEEEPKEDPVPFVDPVYRGPTLIAIIGDEAWFRGNGTGPDSVIRLRVGDEQSGLTLVKTTLPSMVTVQYRLGKYEIDLFTTEEPFFRQDPAPVSSETFLEAVEG